MNERRINSLNLKENSVYNWLEYQFLSMFHLFPSDVQELKWHDFLQDQLTEHQIGYIREEIVSTAIANVFEKYYFKKKLFQFNSECARVVWLRLFNASILHFLTSLIFTYFLSFSYSGYS